MNFWTELQWVLIFKHWPEPRHSWRTFLQPHALCSVVCTPPNSLSISSTTFARLHCLYSRSSIQSRQHSCCPVQTTAPAQSHQRFIIPTQLHSCHSTRKTWCERNWRTHELELLWGSALRFATVAVTYYATAPGRRDAKGIEGPTSWSYCGGQHWDLRQLPWLMQHCVHAEGCSQDAWARRSVKRGAAGKVALLQCSKWVFSFCNEFFPRSLPGWREGKIQQVPEKIGTNPGKNSVAGAGPLGRSGLRVQSTQGQELWVKIGNQCSDFT